MSSQGAGVFLHHRLDPEEVAHRSWTDRFRQYSPSQGWTTFALLILALLVVGWSVTEAEWVESPGLIPVLMWAAIAGGLSWRSCARPGSCSCPPGLILGAAAVLWADGGAERRGGQRDRAVSGKCSTGWTCGGRAANSGGISTDLMPFALMMLTFGWIVGFFSSWFIFRREQRLG